MTCPICSMPHDPDCECHCHKPPAAHGISGANIEPLNKPHAPEPIKCHGCNGSCCECCVTVNPDQSGKDPAAELVGKCCDNGNFGEEHKCQKGTNHFCCYGTEIPHGQNVLHECKESKRKPKTTVEDKIKEIMGRCGYITGGLDYKKYSEDLYSLVELARKEKP